MRTEAEALLVHAPPTAPPLRATDELLHELQVHQIELEMQNEALRQAHILIEESRDRYVDLYDFAPVAYLTLSREGLIEELNLTAAALLGTERKHLLQRRFSKFVAAESHELWYRHFTNDMQHNEQHSCELLLQHADTSHFHARLDSRHIETAGVSAVRITLTDISEHKRLETELRIAAIAFESQEGMLVTDANSVILRVNQGFTQLTGYSEEEVLGKTPALLKSGRQDAAFYERMWSSLKQKRYWQGEMWNKRKSGKIYAEWLTISAVTDDVGNITHYVAAFSDITQNQEAEAEIHRLAYYDPLTNLPNRRLLLDRLGQGLSGSSRSGRYGALLFLDLDNFKNLNDTRGHDVGDQLLIEATHRIQANVREGDTVARLGGDEFVVMLENLSEGAGEAAIQTKLVGEKIREALAQPYDLSGREFHCTSSIGITLFYDHNESVETLLKHADLAMYKAKEAGRDVLRFFDPAMQTALDEHSALEDDLHLALQLGQLQLHYQVQIDNEQRVVGAEALLRWSHPERGIVPPGDFIPLAEETNLILPIGRWVLETACTQIKAWSDAAATRDLRLAVNVSARQFRQAEFIEQVQQALVASGIDATRLKIELTESLVLDNVDDTIIKMHALKMLGVGFSMDDFGTGYSSLSYLKRLPLDQLKIDQSFVRELATDANDASIVRAIITMGQAFGLNVIAEGVETRAQHAFLEQHGCHAYQGYLFGKPLPIEEFERLLST